MRDLRRAARLLYFLSRALGLTLLVLLLLRYLALLTYPQGSTFIGHRSKLVSRFHQHHSSAFHSSDQLELSASDVNVNANAADSSTVSSWTDNTEQELSLNEHSKNLQLHSGSSSSSSSSFWDDPESEESPSSLSSFQCKIYLKTYITL